MNVPFLMNQKSTKNHVHQRGVLLSRELASNMTHEYSSKHLASFLNKQNDSNNKKER